MINAASDLAIFKEKNKGKMSEEKLRPAISSQMTEVAMKYWSEELKSPLTVNNILEDLKSPQLVVVSTCLC